MLEVLLVDELRSRDEGGTCVSSCSASTTRLFCKKYLWINHSKKCNTINNSHWINRKFGIYLGEIYEMYKNFIGFWLSSSAIGVHDVVLVSLAGVPVSCRLLSEFGFLRRTLLLIFLIVSILTIFTVSCLFKCLFRFNLFDFQRIFWNWYYCIGYKLMLFNLQIRADEQISKKIKLSTIVSKPSNASW